MDDPVTSNAVFELVCDVGRDQVGRSKPFMDILSRTLDVQADYNVGQTLYK